MAREWDDGGMEGDKGQGDKEKIIINYSQFTMPHAQLPITNLKYEKSN